MHVDGFRFDLASTLGRESAGFERESAFFNAVRQDPVLSHVKLIAEPWDIGEGGYQVGGFPWPFREWNDKARDDLRGYWRRDGGLRGRVSQRLLGSPTQFHHSKRPATTSVNFLAAHDGFTLWDCVSYDNKHNEANGEDSADGHDNNLSHNMGAEGQTDDPGILHGRERRVRAMLASLLMSQGVPMILAGDEMGHSQNGNNNAYCQDNELAWIGWPGRPELIKATAAMIALRQELGLASRRFAVGAGHGDGVADEVHWLHAEGREMGEEDWGQEGPLGLLLRRPARADVLVILNAGDDCVFALPEGDWVLRLCSAGDEVTKDERVEGEFTAPGQAVRVLVEA